MKVILSNKFYYPRGGDCICTINLEKLLKQKGHDVAIFSMQHPENLETPWNKYFPREVRFTPGPGMLEALRRPLGTREVKTKFAQLLKDFQPDILHLNNIHTQLSPVIAEIAHEQGVKVVWTLHDYKLLCPRYDCLRNGQEICEECFTDKHKVRDYKCMKNSALASFLAYREAKKWSRTRLETVTDAFICPSRFMADKMIQGNFDKTKINTLCNFIDTDKTRKDNYNKEDYYCYIGRLGYEKGIQTLVSAAKQLPYRLKIIGCGPLQETLQTAVSGSNIELLGYKHWPEIKEIAGKARFCVVPSEWYENNPLSIIESQCLGTPVLGSRIGGIPELIEEGKTGMLFVPKDMESLKCKIEEMYTSFFNYEQIALEAHEKYSSEKYYEKLMKIYTSL